MRREDWQARMWMALDAARNRPYEYGACVALAAECVDAMTASGFRAAVEPMIIAARERPITADEISDQVTQRLGSPIPRNLTNQGDVVLFELPIAAGERTGNLSPVLGICTGHLVACAGYPKGIAYLKLERAKLSWAVR